MQTRSFSKPNNDGKLSLELQNFTHASGSVALNWPSRTTAFAGRDPPQLNARAHDTRPSSRTRFSTEKVKISAYGTISPLNSSHMPDLEAKLVPSVPDVPEAGGRDPTLLSDKPLHCTDMSCFNHH